MVFFRDGGGRLINGANEGRSKERGNELTDALLRSLGSTGASLLEAKLSTKAKI